MSFEPGGKATAEAATPRPDRCETCRHWENPAGAKLGECRAQPPQIVEIVQEVQTVAWPETVRNDWCWQWVRRDD